MQVIIIGTGKVANFLCKSIQQSNNTLIAVVGRNKEKVENFSQAFACEGIVGRYNNLPIADMYIIAVNDYAIAEIAVQINNKQGVVVHTSGTMEISILQNNSNEFGILWPIQTIHSLTNVKNDIPIVINGNTNESIQKIEAFALTLTNKISVLNDEKRRKMHLAAVMVNNFTNHLYSLTASFCEKEELPFTLLNSIINETSDQVNYQNPKLIQTGPAKRGDLNTIEAHIELLKTHQNISHIYEVLSKSIIEMYKN